MVVIPLGFIYMHRLSSTQQRQWYLIDNRLTSLILFLVFLTNLDGLRANKVGPFSSVLCSSYDSLFLLVVKASPSTTANKPETVVAHEGEQHFHTSDFLYVPINRADCVWRKHNPYFLPKDSNEFILIALDRSRRHLSTFCLKYMK